MGWMEVELCTDRCSVWRDSHWDWAKEQAVNCFFVNWIYLSFGSLKMSFCAVGTWSAFFLSMLTYFLIFYVQIIWTVLFLGLLFVSFQKYTVKSKSSWRGKSSFWSNSIYLTLHAHKRPHTVTPCRAGDMAEQLITLLGIVVRQWSGLKWELMNLMSWKPIYDICEGHWDHYS